MVVRRFDPRASRGDGGGWRWRCRGGIVAAPPLRRAGTFVGSRVPRKSDDRRPHRPCLRLRGSGSFGAAGCTGNTGRSRQWRRSSGTGARRALAGHQGGNGRGQRKAIPIPRGRGPGLGPRACHRPPLPGRGRRPGRAVSPGLRGRDVEIVRLPGSHGGVRSATAGRRRSTGGVGPTRRPGGTTVAAGTAGSPRLGVASPFPLPGSVQLRLSRKNIGLPVSLSPACRHPGETPAVLNLARSLKARA